MGGPDSLRTAVLAAAAAQPSVTRGRARRVATVVVAACIAASVIIFEGIGGLAHAAGRPLSITIIVSVGWAIASLLLTWIVLGRGDSTLSRRPALVMIAVVVTPFLLFGWMQLFHGTYVEGPFRIGYRCFSYTLLFSAGPLVAFMVLRRGIEPRSPAVLGAGAGAACAAWAGALVDLWCPLSDPLHVLVGHVLPLLVAMACGALAGRALLGVTRVDRSPPRA